jgi:hypothetical protein
LSTFLAEQLPQIIPAALTGGATAAATSGNVLAKAAARQISKEAAEKVAQREAIRTGTSAAIGTGAVQQGADIGAGTYDEIVKELVSKGASPEQAGKAAINLARASGVSGAALSLIANRYLPGGQTLERVLAGGATGKGLLMGAATGALKELPSEVLEETGGRFTQNLALRDVKPEQSLTQGLGATAGQAALGAVGLGGVTGAIGGRGGATPEVTAEQQPPAVVPVTPAPPVAPEAERTLEELLATGKRPPPEYKAPEGVTITAPKGSLDELDQIITAQQQKYDTRKQEIERKQGMNQNPKGQITSNEQLASQLTSMREPPANRIEAGETYASTPNEGTVGISPEVSVPASGAVPPTGGTEAPQRSGVDSTGQNVGAPVTGTAGQQPPVTPPAQIQTPPTGETVGAQTTETKQTKTQRQTATAAPVVVDPRQELLTKRKAQAEALGIDLRDIQQDEVDAQVAETEKRIGDKFNEERKNVVYDDDAQNFIEEAEKGKLSPQFGWEGDKLGALEDMLERNGVDADAVLAIPTDADAVPKNQRAEKLKASLDALNAKREQLREWNRLTADQHRVYLDNLTTDERGQITPKARQKAIEKLNRYTATKERTPSGEVKSNREEGLYETQRTAYNTRTGLSLPVYSELTTDEKDQFKKDLKYRKRNNREIDPTVENIDAAFKNLSLSVNERKGGQKIDEKAALRETEFETYKKVQGEIAAAQEQRKNNKVRQVADVFSTKKKIATPERIGSQFIPNDTAKQVKEGNAKNVLNYLRTASKTPLFREIAQSISKLDLKTKIKYVDKLPKNKLAVYDPKTDTIEITAEGLTDTILLHEFVHAATVKVLDKYLRGDTKGLTEAQIEGAEQLQELMDKAKEELGTRYPDAFENLFEFVTYSLTDKFFQEDLAGIQMRVRQGEKIVYAPTILPEQKTGWTNFMLNVAKLLGFGKKLFEEGETNYDKRNAVLEVFTAFEQIMEAPTERIEREPLAATTQKAPKTTTQRTPEEIIAEQKLPGEKSSNKVREFMTSAAGMRRLATVFANSRYPIKVWEDALQRAKKIVDAGPKLNNIYTQITLSAARAKDLYLTMVNKPAAKLQKAIGEYAQAAKIGSDEALKQLHTYFMALHEPERRAIKFLRNVPLKNSNVQFNGRTINPADFRQDVLDAVESGKLTKAEVRRLRKELDAVVAQYAEASGSSPGGYKTVDINGSDYNVIGNLLPAEVKAIRDKFNGNKKAQAVIEAMRELNKVTEELNKKANYWSKPVQSVVDFYGWENYIPFKGKQVASAQDGMLDYDILKTNKRFAENLQEFQSEFEGRESWSDNSLTQIMSDATRAAMRAGRKDLTLAIKNAIDQKLLMGSVNQVKGLNGKPIEFVDRHKIDLGELSGKTTIFHYNENGSIDVLQVYSEAERNAIRRAYQQTNPLIDMLNQVTSTVGQFHTRYNIAFAPMNYFRDMLTNAFTIGTDMDAATAAQYIGAVTSQVVNGGMYKTWKIASLYNSGKMAELNAFVAKDKSGFSKDVMEYIKEGGMVSYLQGLSAKGTFQNLQKEINSSNLKKAKSAIDGLFDVYADMFELSSRTAAYRITRNKLMREDKLSEEAAKTRAAAYVKNLANFEQTGEWGRGAGAMFMFFRPAATGAVRAIETLGPMIRSTDEAILDLPPEVRKDEKAVAEFRKSHEKQRKAAQAMTLGLAGFGVAMYLLSMALSDDDELGRNRTKTDDINRWTRYARFHIPGMDNPVQIPWGFGLGAFAASGAQVAAMGTGQASIKEGFSNVLSVMMDSFLPLPVSRINMFDNFPAWLMDSTLPSVARPLFEWQMNMDALGREIYNNRQTRVGDAYTGGDNIPELYKSAARTIADVTNGAVDWSPNTMYFFANNYADGLMRIAQTGANMSLLVAGEKAFNPKTDTVLFDSFFGSASNFDAKQFSAIENQIKDKERKLKMFESNPEQFAKYVEANPMDEYLVKMYNEGVNGRLKEYREEANMVRKMPGLSPKDRTDALKNIVQMQNFEKRHMIDAFEAFDITP